jgi:hypothetical protein
MGEDKYTIRQTTFTSTGIGVVNILPADPARVGLWVTLNNGPWTVTLGAVGMGAAVFMWPLTNGVVSEWLYSHHGPLVGAQWDADMSGVGPVVSMCELLVLQR